jgi:predicted ribosomally synthesized peptide with nif11-like leader
VWFAAKVCIVYTFLSKTYPITLPLFKIMARDQVARLYRAAKTDSLLKAKLNQAPDLESFVEMAKAEGYDFTIEEWQQMTNFEVEELKCNLSEIPGI